MFTEGAAGLASKAGKFVLHPFKNRVLPKAERAIADFGGKIKLLLTPAEATESRMLDMFQNVASAAMSSGGMMSRFNIAREQLLDDVLNKFATSFSKQLLLLMWEMQLCRL